MSCVAWLQCADPRWLDGATAAGSYGRPTLHRTTAPPQSSQQQVFSVSQVGDVPRPASGTHTSTLPYSWLHTHSIHTLSCARDNHYCLLKHELEDKILLNINVRGRGEGSYIMSAELRK